GYNAPNFSTAPAAAGALTQYDAGLNGSLEEVVAPWTILYTQIGRTNTAISRAGGVEGMADSLKTIRVAEAKFLRALSYFYLVQQWGDVPMPLTESQTASKEAVRVAAADVYKQIISDLTVAETDLPA